MEMVKGIRDTSFQANLKCDGGTPWFLWSGHVTENPNVDPSMSIVHSAFTIDDCGTDLTEDTNTVSLMQLLFRDNPVLAGFFTTRTRCRSWLTCSHFLPSHGFVAVQMIIDDL